MKAEWINPFIDATLNVFSTMVGVNPVKGKIGLKTDEIASYDISGIIGLAGQAVGSVVISMPETLALHIVSQFVGEEKTTVDSEVIDAIGELTNMIAGNAKKSFSEMGNRFKISIPNVVTGKGHSLSRPANVPCIVVHFSVEGKEFVIEVALKEG